MIFLKILSGKVLKPNNQSVKNNSTELYKFYNNYL